MLKINWRKEIIDRLILYFEKDERLHLLLADMGFAVADKLKAKYPDRVTNCGIMEQAMAGLSSGMSM